MYKYGNTIFRENYIRLLHNYKFSRGELFANFVKNDFAPSKDII